MGKEKLFDRRGALEAEAGVCKRHDSESETISWRLDMTNVELAPETCLKYVSSLEYFA